MSDDTEVTEDEVAAAEKIRDLLIAGIMLVHRRYPLAEGGALSTSVICAGIAEALGRLAHPMPPEDIEMIIQAMSTGIRGFYQDYRESCPCHRGGSTARH